MVPIRREHIPTEVMALIDLDLRFDSGRSYNVLLKAESEHGA